MNNGKEYGFAEDFPNQVDHSETGAGKPAPSSGAAMSGKSGKKRIGQPQMENPQASFVEVKNKREVQ